MQRRVEPKPYPPILLETAGREQRGKHVQDEPIDVERHCDPGSEILSHCNQ